MQIQTDVPDSFPVAIR